MKTYNGDTDHDVILYESICKANGNKSYSIGYADPDYYIMIMIGVCSRKAINRRIKKNGFKVVETKIRYY